VTTPREAVVFQATVSDSHDNALSPLPGFDVLKRNGIDEIIYIVITHAKNVDVAFPRSLDADTADERYPKIKGYYLLILPHI